MTTTVDLQGAADLMKVHPKTVQDLIGAGALPAGKVGRAYVLMTKDVLAHIERTIVEQTAARMRRPTKAVTTVSTRGRSRAGSRTASSSGAICVP